MEIAQVLKPLSGLPEVAPLGIDDPGKRIEKFKIQKQGRSNWCWAAVASSIDAFYHGAAAGKKQCCLAVVVLKNVACCDHPDLCNSGAETECALKVNGTFRDMKLASDLAFDDIKTEIGQGLLIGCGVETSQDAHAIALYGWDVCAGTARVYLQDPLGPALKLFEVDLFKTVGAEDYKWIRAYLTKR